MPNYHEVLDEIAAYMRMVADALDRLVEQNAKRPVPYWPTYPQQYPYYTPNTTWPPGTINCSVDSSGTNG